MKPFLILATVTFAVRVTAEEVPYTAFTHPMITDVSTWDKDRPDPPKVSAFLELSDDQLRGCVPYQTPRIYSLCPNCSRKENGRDYMRRHYPHGVFDFDPKQPDRIVCTTCRERFPDNPKFPQEKRRAFRAPRMWSDLNENQDYIIRWHEQQRPPRNPEDLKPGEDGKWTAYFYMDGALDTRRDVFCQDVMKTLTRAWWYYTHNPKEKDEHLAYRCAWKTVVLLDEYANAFPRWLLCDNYGKDYFNAGDKGAFPYGWSETRYGTARQTSEQNGPGFYRHALDVLGGSRAFRDYEEKEHGPSKYEHLFAKEGEAAPKVYSLSLYEKLCRNVLMPVRRYQGSVLGKWGQGCPINGTQDYARLTHNREMLRLAAQSMFVYPHKSFFVDGGYSEGPGYSGIHLLHAHQGIFRQRGYTDPPNYVVPPDSPNASIWKGMLHPDDLPYMGPLTNYNALRPNRAPHYDRFWTRAFHVWKDLCAPNGGQYALGESQHRNLGSYRHVMTEPRHVTGHVVKTGMKRFLLGDGEGDDQVQINLTAGPYTAHGHRDFLDLQIFDNGHYLADDFGYGKHQMRGRYSSIQVHNSGAYDTFQTPSNNGIPTLLETSIPGIAVARVASHRATEAMARFERTVALISSDLEHPYIVDLFYFKGQGNADKGKRREYFFHASRHHYDQTASCSLPMKRLPGERGMLELEGIAWKEDMLNSQDYGVFFDAHQADGSSSFTVDFEVPDPWRPLKWKFDPKRSPVETEIPGKTPKSALPYKASDDSWANKPAIGIRRHVVGFPGQQAFAYNFPHPSRLHQNTHSDGWGRMPGFLLRHDVADTATDTEFLVVHESWAGKPHVRQVRRLPAAFGSENAIALEVIMPGRRDLIFLSNNDEPASYQTTGVNFRGRFGVVVRKGDKADAALIGGTTLTVADAGINYRLPHDVFAGTVLRSERAWRGHEDGLVVDCDLPESVVGSWMLVRSDGKSLKDGDDPDEQTAAGWAFEIAGVTRRNGQTFVRTKEDHGLEINAGICREFFKPHSHLNGRTTFRIYPRQSNQGLVRTSHAGGPLPGPTEVTLSPAATLPNAQVQFLALPIDAPPVQSVNDRTLAWRSYNKPLLIDRDCRLLVRALPPNGVKIPVAQRYTFTLPPRQAELTEATQLKPKTVFVNRFYKSTGSNIERPLIRSFYKQPNDQERGRHVNGIGFLQVSRPGRYAFHYHGRQPGKLTLGGKVLFDGDDPSGERGEVFLEPGYYDFHFVAKGNVTFDFEWEGPGFERRRLHDRELFHLPSVLSRFEGEFNTQKTLR